MYIRRTQVLAFYLPSEVVNYSDSKTYILFPNPSNNISFSTVGKAREILHVKCPNPGLNQNEVLLPGPEKTLLIYFSRHSKSPLFINCNILNLVLIENKWKSFERVLFQGSVTHWTHVWIQSFGEKTGRTNQLPPSSWYVVLF